MDFLDKHFDEKCRAREENEKALDNFNLSIGRMQKFHVKLRFHANCIDITHPANFFIKAYDSNHARELSLQMYPNGRDIEIKEYNGK